VSQHTGVYKADLAVVAGKPEGRHSHSHWVGEEDGPRVLDVVVELRRDQFLGKYLASRPRDARELMTNPVRCGVSLGRPVNLLEYETRRR